MRQQHSDGVRRNFGLDLVRFTAIGCVLTAHFSALFHPPTTGWGAQLQGAVAMLGVDLFFVLSGLLIGRLLFDIAESGPTLRGWRIFMTRRWLRTLPLYWVWLLMILLVLPPPPHPAAMLLRFATLTQNLSWPMPDGLWFMVSWSLTVEEWFYVLFSAIFLGLAAWLGARRAAWPAIALFIAVPLIWREWLPPTETYLKDVLTVASLRLDAIAYGVALAWLERCGSRLFRLRALAALAGVGLPCLFWVQDIGGLWLGFPVSPMTYLNLENTATSLGIALVLPALMALPAPWRPLRFVVVFGSQISYGVYLMHMTVIEAVARANLGLGAAAQIALGLALIAGLATLSFRWFESPILALRPSQGLGAAPARAARLATASSR